MKFFVILSLLATLLTAQMPNVYASLGDEIYTSVENIKKLKDVAGYAHLKDKINKYIEDVEQAREDGLAIDAGKKDKNKSDYLKKLRGLSKEYAYFKRGASSSFKSAVKNSDNELFLNIVNSGLLDTDEHKKEILSYYKKHTNEIKPSGLLENLLNEDERKRERQKANRVTKRKIDMNKIKRLRENDKLQEAAEIKRLEAEVKEKKKQIREYQQRELSDN